MADAVQTQEKTKVITFQSGLGLVTDLYPVDLDQVKQLGLYTAENYETIKEIFFSLLETFNRDGSSPYFELIPYQKVELRVRRSRNMADDGTLVELESSNQRPDDPEFHGSRREHLFLVDAVSLILGIARTLQIEFYGKQLKSDLLKNFADPSTEDFYLTEWGLGHGKNYISQEAVAREKNSLNNLFSSIYQAIQEIDENLEKDSDTETEQEEIDRRAKTTPSATIPENLEEILAAAEEHVGAAEGSSDEATPGEDTPVVDLDDHETRLELEKAKLFVRAQARTMLLDQIFEQSGLTLGELPDELYQLHQELLEIIDRELNGVVFELSQEQLAEFMQPGAITARMAVYRQLLQRLFTRPENGFGVLYKQFFANQITFLEQRAAQENRDPAEPHQAAQTITALTNLITTVTTESELAAIHQEFVEWKAELQEKLTELEAKRKALTTEADTSEEEAVLEEPTEQPTQTPDEDYTPTLKETDIPAAPIVLTSTQLQQITTPQNIQLSPAEQAVIPKQAGHVIWGTMAQLFPEEALLQGTVPPQLFDQVNTAAIDYLARLSPAELHKLSKSPSSLIRHIKNLTLRIQTDAAFGPAYEAFTQAAGAPIINRTERIEVETNWALENSKYELFTAHNITIEVITKSPTLQKEYREAEQQLEVKVYAFILKLSNQELLDLYLHPNKRKELFEQISRSLNADPNFKRELSDFYTELIEYYTENGLLEEQQTVTEGLQRTSFHHIVQEEGHVRFVVEDLKKTDAQKLFIEQLKQELRDDSEVVAQNTANILDSLLLTYGPEATENILRTVDTRLLGPVFSLPVNEINDSNHATIREVLINYARVRVMNLAPAEGPIQRGFVSIAPAAAAAEIVRNPTPYQSMTKVVEENGAETTTEALSGNLRKKADVFEKIVASQWNNLSLEEAAAVYLWSDNPIPESLRQRIASHNTDMVADKMALRPVPQFLEFNGDLKELVKAAERGNFKYLAFETPVAQTPELQPANTPLAVAYRQTAQAARLQHEVAYAAWQAETAQRREELAIALATTVEALEIEYANAVLGNSTQAIYAPQPVSDLDAVAVGAGVASAPALAAQLPNLPQFSAGSQVGGLRTLATDALKQKLLNSLKGKLTGMAASIATKAATGPAGWASLAYQALRNKKIREFLSALGTLSVSGLMYIAGNLAGLASLGGMMWLLGPAGFFPGLVLGSVLSYQLPWLRIPGLDVRFPSNPFQFGSDAVEGSARGYQSMAEMRAEAKADALSGQNAATINSSTQPTTTVTSNAGTNSAPPGSSGSGTNPDGSPSSSSSGLGSQNAVVNYSTPTAAATTSSAFSLANVGLLAPLMAVGSGFILTIFTVVVISGAFLIDLPTKPFRKQPFTNDGQQASAKYVTATKTADKGDQPNEIRNNTPTEISYTIVIEPKPGYSIKINEASDKFSSFGDQTEDLTSPLDISQIPADPFQDPAAPITYSITIGSGFKDAFITNTFSINFDVMDYTGNVVESNQVYNTAASVMVGEPKIGCWPVTGSVTSIPFMLSVPTHAKTDAWDIGASLGTPIYAPFPGMVNDRGWDTTGYGNLMTLQFVIPGDSTPRTVFFGHLSGVAPKFKGKSAEPVAAGEVIGYVGSTGNSTGPHLHYELQNNRDFPTDPGLGIRNIVPNGFTAGIGTPTRSCR